MIIAIIPIGLLFKLMYWPGSIVQLTAGIVSMLILLVVTFLLYKKSKEELFTYYKNYIVRIVFWTILCILFYLVSNKQLLQIQYRNNPELCKLKINAYENHNNIEY